MSGVQAAAPGAWVEPPRGGGLPIGYVEGARVAFGSVSTVTIAPAAVRSSDDVSDIVSAALLTADITAAGVNGLDFGIEAALTWYALYIIADTSGANPVASLLSASFSAPTLPAGYDKFRRVGCVRNDAASDFLPFLQRWNGRTRRYWYDVNMNGVAATPTRILSAGSAVIFAALGGLASFVPPTSTNVILIALDTTNNFRLRPTGSTSDAMRFFFGTLLALSNEIEMPCSAAQSIDYRVGVGSDILTLNVEGFDDEL